MGLDFSTVRFDTRPEAEIAALARTLDNTISISHEATRLPARIVVFILAHELAHIAQKRIGSRVVRATLARAVRSSSYLDSLELEADQAASAILRGVPTMCTLPDVPERPAHWGPLGHYYTVYYVMLQAGVPAKEARIRAFFCQLPDEVWQFDATAATRDYNEAAPDDDNQTLKSGIVSIGTDAAGIKRATPWDEFVMREGPVRPHTPGMKNPTDYFEDPVSKRNRLHFDKAVVRGLHALTGRSYEAETQYRLRVLRHNWKDLVLSGLALHPLGDSFSHRPLSGDHEMYGDHHGHLFDGHEPDNVASRPANYMNYAKTLFETVSQLIGGRNSFKLAAEPVLKEISSIHVIPRSPSASDLSRRGAGHPGSDPRLINLSGGVRYADAIDPKAAEERGLKKLIGALSITPGFDSSYRPEKLGYVYWKEFAQKHHKMLEMVGGAAAVRAKIERAALRWDQRLP
jgi:hypothetical protein